MLSVAAFGGFGRRPAASGDAKQVLKLAKRQIRAKPPTAMVLNQLTLWFPSKNEVNLAGQSAIEDKGTCLFSS